ncbi:MAG: tetratricopeptide repeat protein [Pseudomonadales bacterium]|nr:tetratricopeptide repeat protein [Pseudomonadales bacterium]
MSDNGEIQRLLEASRVEEKKGNLHGSIRHLQVLSDLLPNNASIFNKLGIMNYGVGELNLAEKNTCKALALSPNVSSYHNTLALIFKKKGDLASSLESLQQALRIDDKNAQAWNNLGLVYKDQQNLEEAERCFKRAIEIVPQFFQALTHLGGVYKLMSKPSMATQFHLKAIEANPNDTDARFNLGNSLKEEGRYEDAYHTFGEVLDRDKQHVGALLGQALIELVGGNYNAGFDKLELRFQHPLELQPVLPNDIAYWQGENLDNKTLLITWEQGLGDQIQFVRYVGLIVAGRYGNNVRVLVQTPSALLRLFETNGEFSTVPQSDIPKTSDFYCPIMSLSRVLGTASDTIPHPIPYFSVPEALVASWGHRLDDRAMPKTKKVGLVWQGDPKNQTDHKRSISFDLLKPLLCIQGVSFFSLQFDGDFIESWGLVAGSENTYLAPEIEDFMDTAAILQNMDLLISVDTSIVHLAGALNRPVWTLISYVPDWRWMKSGSHTAWYPSMRLYRQIVLNDWESVVSEVEQDLLALVASEN